MASARALGETHVLLQVRKPAFEAGFSVAGGLAFSDVRLLLAQGT